MSSPHRGSIYSRVAVTVATTLALGLSAACRQAGAEHVAAVNAGATRTSAPAKYAADVPKSILTPDTVQTERLGTLKFFDGLPDEATVQKAYDNLDFQRGMETFLNGIPAASIYSFLKGLESVGVVANQGFGITEDAMDARQLWLTPNTTTIYVLGSYDLATGPVVLEAAPSLVAPLDDAYFRFVTDVGFTGPDQGRGGKYLLVPPGYKGKLPKEGYFIVHSKTYRNWMLGRAFVKDGDKAATVNKVKATMRVYPYAQVANPPATTFVNLSGKKYNTIHANDFSFYEELNDVVQHEPADAFDPELVGVWAAIGIKKGRPFAPDARMKKILTDAVAVGNATARVIGFRPRSKTVYFYTDRQWYSPFAGGSHEFLNNGELVLDDRTFFHYFATGITPSMAKSEVGQGSAYAFTAHDASGRYLDGGKTYSVTLPGPVPAKDFWSFVVYDGQTRSVLETDQVTGGLDSLNPNVKPNADGTYTVWFGPQAPVGQESNWVQTMPGKSFNTLFRLYGPLQPWFDKTWKPGDFELAK